MNIDNIFDSCVDYSLSEKSFKLLEMISNLESVKDFTNDAATDQELDGMLEEMARDRALIPMVHNLLHSCIAIPNNKDIIPLGEFI